MLETYRECLRDVLDLAGLLELLRKLHRRELSLVEVETPTASPFASSLLFDYVATYMYEGDTPNAERRAAALSLDRDLLRELLGQEELRDLIDPGALEQVEDDLQRRSERARRANSRDELHDVLRRVGDLTGDEAASACSPGSTRGAMLDELARERRAMRGRVPAEERWIDAADAGLYRDALGVVPPGGLPEAFLDDVPDALRAPARALRRARTARSRPPSCGRATGSTRPPRCASSSAPATLVRGELRPGGTGARVVRPRGAAAAAPRLARGRCAARSSRPTSARSPRFLPAWQGVDRHPAAAPGSTGCARCSSPLQGLALPAATWERDVLPRRVGAYSPTWMDQLCASGELVWVGAGALGRALGPRRAVLPRRRRR